MASRWFAPPPGRRCLLGDCLALLRGELLRAGLPSLIPAESPERDGGRVLALVRRWRCRGLAGRDIDDQFAELVRVPRSLWLLAHSGTIWLPLLWSRMLS